jgi:putative transposase
MEWCSLDPGVRTFMTLYSPEQTTAYKYGVGDAKRILRLCLHLDKLITKRSKSKRKRNLKKAENRLRYKIKNLVDEVHWKIISHLTKHFQNIIIPPFEVKSMVNKATRKISSKSVRQLYNWRHYTFRQRLLNHSKLTGTNVYVREESFTTKTCTICGKINIVNANKKINCNECHETVDRDMNGARNIFLKHVGTGVLTSEVQSVL